MPILAIFRVEGDPDDLLARYDQTLPAATANSTVRPEVHICARTDSGVVMIDTWKNQEALRQGVIENEKFQEKCREAGWPDEVVHVYEIHNQGWPTS